MSEWLTTSETAARLGVKPATVYAYVSRGVLERRVASDGKTSLFAADHVDRVRRRRRPGRRGELGGTVITAITDVDDGVVRHRGRDLTDLARSATFEDVTDLLWEETSARPWRLSDDRAAAVRRTAEALGPGAQGIDRLRAAVAALAAHDPLRFDERPDGLGERGRMLVVGLTTAVGGPERDGVADRLWAALAPAGSPPEGAAALDRALVCLADHGLAPSTFAVRVAASVRTDPYSTVTTGLGVVGGRLHGAASAAVHRLLDEGHRTSPESVVGDLLTRGDRLPGLGHPIHRSGDPRFALVMETARSVFDSGPRWSTVERTVDLLAGQAGGPPNVDLALGAVTWAADLPPDAGEIVFAVARTVGWLAHDREERREAPLRFRSRAAWTARTAGEENDPIT